MLDKDYPIHYNLHERNIVIESKTVAFIHYGLAIIDSIEDFEPFKSEGGDRYSRSINFI
jgi:hypothetical protein